MKFATAILIAILGAAPMAAGEIAQRKGPATLEIRFDSLTPKITLADVITVKLEVEGTTALRVKAPDRFPTDYPWQLIELSKVERTPIDAKRVRWRLTYKFAPREPAKKVALAFPEIRLRESDDPEEERALTWEPVDFEVTTSITDPDRADIRDITEIESLPTAPDAGMLDWRIVALAVLVVLLIFVVFFTRALLKRRDSRSPTQIALYEWQRLVAMGLPEKGRSERFVTLLTLLVRQFLERQFGLLARRQTTPEFLQALAQQSALSDEEKRFLTTFFQRSDAIKFAGIDMSPSECSEWAEATRRFLQNRIAISTSK